MTTPISNVAKTLAEELSLLEKVLQCMMQSGIPLSVHGTSYDELCSIREKKLALLQVSMDSLVNSWQKQAYRLDKYPQLPLDELMRCRQQFVATLPGDAHMAVYTAWALACRTVASFILQQLRQGVCSYGIGMPMLQQVLSAANLTLEAIGSGPCEIGQLQLARPRHLLRIYSQAFLEGSHPKRMTPDTFLCELQTMLQQLNLTPAQVGIQTEINPAMHTRNRILQQMRTSLCVLRRGTSVPGFALAEANRIRSLAQENAIVLSEAGTTDEELVRLQVGNGLPVTEVTQMLARLRQ